MSVNLRELPDARLDFVKPMLPLAVAQLPSGANWLYELKLDGYRVLIVKQRRVVTVFSRRGKNLNSAFPTIAAAFSFVPDNTILDGELVVLDHNGKPSFAALQKYHFTSDALYFYAFDLIAYRGKDLRKLPLTDRRTLLEDSALSRQRDPVRVSSVFQTSPSHLIAAAKKSGLEGIVAKRADSRYESGERSGAWVKYKTNEGQEFVIGGYKPSTNSFEYLLVGYYEGKELIFIAKIRNGFTPSLRRAVAQRFVGLRTSACPFTNLPEPANARRGEAITVEVMNRIQWVKPKLVAQIEFTEWTKGNHLRHSKFVGLRDDKKPIEVTKERRLQTPS
jgi:DNA ligase D-like protein (predicted ligase)